MPVKKKKEYTESISVHTQDTRVDIHQEDTATDCSDRQITKKSIILIFSGQLKVTLRSSQTQYHYSKIITLSNLYEVNSSRHYECKGLFTEEFQSTLELQNHQIPKVRTGIRKSLQQQLETSERFRTINHLLLSKISNNRCKNSPKSSCHLRLYLNTTQMCESAFKLKTTIDHTRHVCNTLNLKLLIQHNNSNNLNRLLMSCSKFLLIEG